MLLVRKYPEARAKTFFRDARRWVPRFTLGTFVSFYFGCHHWRNRARATRTVRTNRAFPKPREGLVGDHALQHRLVRLIGEHALVQLLLAFVRLRGQDMTAKGMIAGANVLAFG